MTGGDGTSGLGEWLDCECPECGTWFPVGERRCPGCGATSICTEDKPLDEMLDELIDEMELDGPEWVEIEAPPDVQEGTPEAGPGEPGGWKAWFGGKLRSFFA